MDTARHIKDYIESHTEEKRDQMQELHNFILKIKPKNKLWFLDGRNAEGKIVSNPNIGYGSYRIKYADGKSREFYQVGLSANSTGISVYIMGLPDKKYLENVYGKKLGKASVSGYCIRFRSLKDINLDVLKEAVLFGFEATKGKP